MTARRTPSNKRMKLTSVLASAPRRIPEGHSACSPFGEHRTLAAYPRCWADPLAGVQVMAHDVAWGRFKRPVASAKTVSGSRRELLRGDTRLGVITQDPDASEFGGTSAWLEPGVGYEGVRHLFGEQQWWLGLGQSVALESVVGITNSWSRVSWQ
jgi:hypothetical protein